MSQHDIVKRRYLEICAEIEEINRAWFADGRPTPQGVRAALKAERARLDLEMYDLKAARGLEKKAAIEMRGKSMTAKLIEKLEALGRKDLVDQAREESLQAVEAAGLGEAFRSRG